MWQRRHRASLRGGRRSRGGRRKSPGRRGRGDAGRVGLQGLSLPRSDIYARLAARTRAEALIQGEAETPPRPEELGASALSPLAGGSISGFPKLDSVCLSTSGFTRLS
nr:PREDICTED: uncharacterized protein LOC103558832 [Equus przewalskii]